MELKKLINKQYININKKFKIKEKKINFCFNLNIVNINIL